MALLIAARLGALETPDQPSQPGRASAQATAQDAAPDWWEGQRATGDWGGVRTTLEAHGLSIAIVDIADATTVASGGIRRSSAVIDLVDIGPTLDLGRLVGWHGGFIGGDVTLYAGPFPSDDVGDWQGFSDIESRHEGVRLASLWFEQWLAQDSWRFVVGEVTANGYFDQLDAARDFMNTSAEYSPTLFSLPSYPRPRPMADAFWYLGDHARLAAGVAALPDTVQTRDTTAVAGRSGRVVRRRTTSGSSPNALAIVQGDAQWSIGDVVGDGHALVGVFDHHQEIDRFDGGTQTDSLGGYAAIEQVVLRRGHDDRHHGLAVFAQVGVADASVSEVRRHEAVGVVLHGTTASRSNDSVGVYATRADFTTSGVQAGGSETTWEGYYRWQVLAWLSLQPDVQYVIDPSGDQSIGDAWVLSLRVRAAL